IQTISRNLSGEHIIMDSSSCILFTTYDILDDGVDFLLDHILKISIGYQRCWVIFSQTNPKEIPFGKWIEPIATLGSILAILPITVVPIFSTSSTQISLFYSYLS